ncbi:MAG: hypothetical protein ABJZ55_12155 [Fuerstiella sp.]
MSASQQVESMSADQFQAWVQAQLSSLPEGQLGHSDQSDSKNTLQQCDQILQQWDEQRQQADDYELALRESQLAQRGLRKQLVDALEELHGARETINRRPPEVARFRPTRKASGASGRSSVPAPATAPVIQVSAPSLGQQVIEFAYSGGRGSQPSGSSGAEIYFCVSDDDDVPESGFRFAAWATRSPHVMRFSDKDSGKVAHYRLRWINAKGESGPWSETATAAIPGMAELV